VEVPLFYGKHMVATVGSLTFDTNGCSAFLGRVDVSACQCEDGSVAALETESLFRDVT